MSDEEKTPEPEATEGEVPQSVADSLAALSTDARAMAQLTARGWKITAVVFAVLLLVITIYLGILYSKIGKLLDAETVVGMGFNRINDTLRASCNAPDIDSGEMPAWVAGKLAEMAPQIMNEQVKPVIEGIPDRLPEIRQKLVAQFGANAPRYVDTAMDRLTTDLLPRAEAVFMDEMKRATGDIMDRVDQNLERIITELMLQHKDDLTTLSPERMPQIRQTMEAEIEEQMGPIMDQMFEGIEPRLRSIRQHMQELVRKYDGGELSREEKLEIQLMRLIRRLFEVKALQKEEPVESLFQSLMNKFDISELGEPARQEIRDVVPAGAVNWQEIPPDARQSVRRILQQQGVQAGEEEPGIENIPEEERKNIPEEVLRQIEK